MSSIYAINKGINRSIMFRGLEGQYIGYLAGGLVGLLLLFVVLYIVGANTYVCIALVFGLGTGLIYTVSRLSHKYGRYGLMKRGSKRQVPDYLAFNSRIFFIRLKHKNDQSS